MNRKAHVACNVDCLFKNEGLLKVTGSHVHCNCRIYLGSRARWIRCYYRPL